MNMDDFNQVRAICRGLGFLNDKIERNSLAVDV